MCPGPQSPGCYFKEEVMKKMSTYFQDNYSDWVFSIDHHVLCTGMVYLPDCSAIS